MNPSSNLLLSFYGDDFTGSTDSMEALTTNGVKTVLFLEVPSKGILQEQFDHIQAFGVAGVSRTMSPTEMDQKLKPILKQLQTIPVPIIHYKICSTFDSSPEIGSIGKVIDIGKELFKSQPSIPVLVGCPKLKRYTVFGNHFAGIGDQNFRLDRHPTMSKHPVTPMNEADLRYHLSNQTNKNIDTINVLELEDKDTLLEKYIKKATDSDVIIIDILNDYHLEKIGMILWEQPNLESQFVIGSSGIQYALTDYWKENNIIEFNTELNFTAKSVNQMLVISGSCSPVTLDQINWAERNGFVGIKVATEELVQPSKQTCEFDRILNIALDLLNKGEDIIIYTSLGPDDPSINKTKEVLLSMGINPSKTGAIIGEQLGKLTKKILKKTGLKRAVIAGGDTSGYATKELGIYALEMLMPVAPGGPLCKCYSEDPEFNGLELALKGGQVGTAEYFGIVRSGTEIPINN